MRLCLLSARFPPQRCGVGDYTYFLACALARMGHEVHVLTSWGDLDEALYPVPDNLFVGRVISWWGLRAVLQVVKYVRRIDPDTLVIEYAPNAFDRRGIAPTVSLLTLLVRATGRTRVVTNFHELYVPFAPTPKRVVGALWQRGMALLSAASSHQVIATTAEWSRRLRRWGIRKPMPTVPVGSNIPRVTVSEMERAELRHRILGTRAGLLFGVFGAIHDREIRGLLTAARQLKTEHRTHVVWIGGAKQVREREPTDGDITYSGWLTHPQVSRLVTACDLLVLPFIDGISTRRTSAVTALQHGVPLLSTRGVEVEPYFVHGENVFLVPAGDQQALADAVIQLARLPQLRDTLAKGARRLYESHFAWSVVAGQMARVLEQG